MYRFASVELIMIRLHINKIQYLSMFYRNQDILRTHKDLDVDNILQVRYGINRRCC